MPSKSAPSVQNKHLHLAEILGALSFALDLTEGQPEGHCIRCCWIGVHIGKQFGLDQTQLWELYYTLLLKDLGCSSNAARLCQLYLADDLAIKRDFKTLDGSLPQVLKFILSHTGLKSGLAERFNALFHVVSQGGNIVRDLIETRCETGAEIALRLRFPESVADNIRHLDEHWDGGGHPNSVRGKTIPPAAQIALLAQIVDVFQFGDGPKAAIAEVKKRSGTWFDPQIVEAFLAAETPELWQGLAANDLPERVFALEPVRISPPVDEDYLDDIAAAFARVVDRKSPFTAGHSERVTVFTDLIARVLGYSESRRRVLRRAALLHDIGKLGVSNSILDKTGKPDAKEWAEIRQHPVYSELILSRIPAFADLATIGGGHHERLDGKGYPRGISGDEIPMDVRIVTVADVFDALTADRPYRAAMPVHDALAIMRKDIGTAFDKTAFGALETAIADMEQNAA